MTKQTFKAHEVSNKPQDNSIMYHPAVGGYVAYTQNPLISVIIGNVEDYYRYLAGERTHLHSDYDSKLHTIDVPGNMYNAYFDKDNGIPFYLKLKANAVQCEIPPGQYRASHNYEVGSILSNIQIQTDKYIPLKKHVSQSIYEDLQRFIQQKELYEKENVRHRKGVLLYGPPGNGKTREIEEILQNSEKDGIYSIFIPSSYEYLSNLDTFKKALKGKTTVFVLEEITERTERDKLEELLSFLDGETSWNNCYIIATTNYPESLPANVVYRPGRFDSVIEFQNPNKDERMAYLKGRGFENEDCEKIAALTEGLSLDYLVQCVNQSRIFGISVTDYLKQSKEKRYKISKSFKNSMGIGADDF